MMAQRSARATWFIALVISAASTRPAGAQHLYNDCPPEGSGVADHIRALNRQKNREGAPRPSDIDPKITLAALVEPGDDRQRWSEDRAATIRGLVWTVEAGSIESTNCRALDLRDRDTVIEIVVDSAHTLPWERVVVEISPRWRAAMAARHVDWSTDALRRTLVGHRVELTGWMLMDREHTSESDNTNIRRPNNVRATAWELHPVTALRVLP